MKNLSIKWKLTLLVLLAAISLIVVGLVGNSGIGNVGTAATEIGETRLPSIIGLAIVNEGQTAVRATNREVPFYENDYKAQDKFAAVLKKKSEVWKRIERGWKIYEPLPQTKEEEELWKKFLVEWDTWKKGEAEFDEIVKELVNNETEKGQKQLFTRLYAKFDAQRAPFARAEELLGKISDLNERVAKEEVESAKKAITTARTLMLVISLIAIALAVAFGMYIINAITRPLSRAVEVANAVAAGDLTSRIAAESKDETGKLMEALKAMNDNLVKLVGNVRTSVDTIATGTGQIATGNSDLSQRTEEQASSLEETASSMEELTSTVKQNAENAKQANQLAKGASDIAARGGEVVGKVVTTMSSINDSSKKIVDIISVIEGIAFQTNILALNAAVEAARAGEQGRGFAVVASEVRSLAQRSAAAAKEIKSLIGDSVREVEDGTVLVDQAGKTMEEIVSAVRRVTDIMAEISAASAEQSSGIEQVNQAITQMDDVTQQNAALVEEAAAAAESLEEEAQNLAQSVSVFKLDASSSMQVAHARPAAHHAPTAKVPAAPAPKAAAKQPTPRKAAGKAKALPAAKEEDEEWKEF